MKLLTADPPPYVYRVKGRYWYFRCGGLSARIDAELGTDAFGARYEELLRLSQRGDAPPTPQPRRTATQALWQVYFLGWGDGPIKIGIALDPATRLYQAQTYSPYKLELWRRPTGCPSLPHRSPKHDRPFDEGGNPMFGILKAAVEAVKLPVDVAADIVTLGGEFTDRREPYTVSRCKRLMRKLNED